MRYNINLDQCFMMKYDLSINASVLLMLIHSAPSWAEPHDSGWYWLAHRAVMNEAPLFFKNPKTVTRARVELENKGLISQKVMSNKNLFRLTEDGKGWGRQVVTKVSGGDKSVRTGGDKSVRTGGDKSVTQSYNKDHNTNYHKKPPISPKGEGGVLKKSQNDFDRFWKSYPKKVGKQAAIKSWDKTKKIRPELDLVLEALEKQKKSKQWTKNGGQYIPNPTTWLNQGRWDDEAPEVTQDSGRVGFARLEGNETEEERNAYYGESTFEAFL